MDELGGSVFFWGGCWRRISGLAAFNGGAVRVTEGKYPSSRIQVVDSFERDGRGNDGFGGCMDGESAAPMGVVTPHVAIIMGSDGVVVYGAVA